MTSQLIGHKDWFYIRCVKKCFVVGDRMQRTLQEHCEMLFGRQLDFVLLCDVVGLCKMVWSSCCSA